MSVEVARVKALRDKTGAGVLACREALAASRGDVEKAVLYLREKGLAIATKKAGRTANDGLVYAYIHAGGRLGALVEVNCETDFVARTDDFRTLVHSIALQIAGADPPPQYVSQDEIPVEVRERHAADLDRYATETCLLEQPFIKDPTVRVRDLLTETIAKVGEHVTVRRFSRFQLGGP